jgi:hypothetical protein
MERRCVDCDSTVSVSATPWEGSGTERLTGLGKLRGPLGLPSYRAKFGYSGSRPLGDLRDDVQQIFTWVNPEPATGFEDRGDGGNQWTGLFTPGM